MHFEVVAAASTLAPIAISAATSRLLHVAGDSLILSRRILADELSAIFDPIFRTTRIVDRVRECTRGFEGTRRRRLRSRALGLLSDICKCVRMYIRIHVSGTVSIYRKWSTHRLASNLYRFISMRRRGDSIRRYSMCT